jgi:hypothetical protein
MQRTDLPGVMPRLVKPLVGLIREDSTLSRMKFAFDPENPTQTTRYSKSQSISSK